MKKNRILFISLLFLLSAGSAVFIQVKQSENRRRLEKQVQRDSVVNEKIKPFLAAIYRNHHIADSIINRINEQRVKDSLPGLNYKLEGMMEDLDSPLFYGIKNEVLILGACHYNEENGSFSDAVMFNLYSPDDYHYVSLYPTIDKHRFNGRSRERATFYKIWKRKELTAAEVQSALSYERKNEK